ncbi:MAG: hypothetical protein IPK73_16520 [Candidatus Obscuribacter sp.]|nr:hypothetical protein [Candidatus Obscuribacter sp.]MBK9278767.1 hypothetical protein [Candidatus Obscuribacter sp.]
METTERLVKRNELAKQLGVHGDTVERWAKAGKHGLRWVKLGKLVYIDTADFKPGEKRDPNDLDPYEVEALFNFATEGIETAFDKYRAEQRMNAKPYMIAECIRRLQLYGEQIVWRCSRLL